MSLADSPVLIWIRVDPDSESDIEPDHEFHIFSICVPFMYEAGEINAVLNAIALERLDLIEVVPRQERPWLCAVSAACAWTERSAARPSSW